MASYTRQSSFADGDIIQASDFNDEFNQLVNAFANTSGHKHDGTAAEGPVIGLIGDPGVATPINKVVVDDTNNRVGVFVDVSGTSTEQVRIQDGVILPVTNNDIDIGSTSLKFKDGYFAGDVTANNISSTAFNGDILPDADNTRDLGSTTLEWKDLYIDGTAYLDAIDLDGTSITATGTEINLLDGVTSTTAELNIVDGDTTATATTVAAADRVVLNDNGTMVQAAVTDLDTFFSATTKTLTNKTLTSPVLNGTISGTSIKDEDDMSSDSASHLATQQSIKAYVDAQVTAQDLDFQADTGGALNIDLDSETLTFTGGTGIDTSGSGNAVTFAIDSTVATLTGTQTLTNKTLTTPTISSITNTGTITLPTSTDTLVGRATTDTLTNKTLTSAVLNGTISGTSIKDEDAMTSDSASHLATQQSIKAYVDAQVGGISGATGNELENVVEDTTPQLGGNLDVNGNSIVSASAGNISITPDTTGSVIIDGLSHPQADGTAGQFLKTDGSAQLAFATVTQATGNELENVVEDTSPQLGGALDTNGNNITFADDDAAVFGADSDLTILHDSGTNNNIFKADSYAFRNKANGNLTFDMTPGATKSAKLYHQGSEKLAITAGGVTVTGTLGATAVTGDGSGLTNLPASGDGGIAMAIALG